MARVTRNSDDYQRMLDSLQKASSGYVGGGGGGGGSGTFSSSSVTVVPQSPPPSQASQAITTERIKDLMDNPPTWEAVMAIAMAQYEVGRMDSARFLLSCAQEIRLKSLQDEKGFEALRRSIEEQE